MEARDAGERNVDPAQRPGMVGYARASQETVRGHGWAGHAARCVWHIGPRLMIRVQSDRRLGTVGIFLGLIALNLAIYAPVFEYAFVDFDDPEHVTQNPPIASGLRRQALKWAWTTA